MKSAQIAMRDIDLSVIIVTWNVADLIISCLESVFVAAKDLRTEVIVVDNDSADSTVERVRTRFPDVQLVGNNYNAGFSVATNQGLRMCRGRYALLLNPDTLVSPDALTRMVNFAGTQTNLGLLGPKVQLAGGEIHEVCARSFPTPLDWFWYYSFIGQVFRQSQTFGKLYLSYWDHKSSREVEVLSGAAMLIPRRTLEEVGLLDETHPMYLEDIDYCCRVRRAGRIVYYLAEASVIHYGGQSSKLVPRQTKVLILDAHALFFQRYGRPWDPWLFRLVALAVIPIRLPILGIVKLFSGRRHSSSAAVKRISLRGEVVTFLWALGLMRSPDIRKVKLMSESRDKVVDHVKT